VLALLLPWFLLFRSYISLLSSEGIPKIELGGLEARDRGNIEMDICPSLGKTF